MDALKVFAKQCAKNVEKQPGWIYLLITVYLVLWSLDVPSHFPIGGWWPDVPIEVWAILSAFLLYQVGDALDKVTFKRRNNEGKWVDRFQPETFKDAIRAARDKFGIHDGIYNVSMKILDEAQQARFSVHFLNEIAKFFRSLIAPMLAIAFFLSCKLSMPWSLVLLAAALLGAYVLAVEVYPRFKNLHRINLYKKVVALPAEDQVKITWQDLGTVRMFFWQGSLIATATRPSMANPALKDVQQASSTAR